VDVFVGLLDSSLREKLVNGLSVIAVTASAQAAVYSMQALPFREQDSN
jgi:hypothetical protein